MTALDGAVWRKSRRSGGNGQNCVEVALTPHMIGVRDSKDRDGGILAVSPATWRSFLAATRRGDFDA